MTSAIITVQYLEDSSGITDLDIPQLVEHLRMAVDRLPFSHLLIGWQVPIPVLDACHLEAERLGLRFLRWQPLLTTDKGYTSDPSWETEGLTGTKVIGYLRQPEFTFFCPNHPAVQAAVLKRLELLIQKGIYQGFFLDRVRFPSPSRHPASDLACFCEHCIRKAACHGIDLQEIRQAIIQQLKTKEGRSSYIKSLLSTNIASSGSWQNQALNQLLAFRQKSINEFLTQIIQPIREAHLEIGLDCFSPCLANMVGQRLDTLSQSADWIKLMTYAHTLAPAGIPFEILGLAGYLSNTCQIKDRQVMEFIRHSTGLPFPSSRITLEKRGLSPSALHLEVRRGIQATRVPVLAGIELVDLPGITHLDSNQIRADLTAIRRAGPHGLAISWDLFHISLEKLELASQAYLGNR